MNDPVFAQTTSKPFPQHVPYFAGCIKPDIVSQKELDDSVRFFYNRWKERYINTDCEPGECYVWFEKPGKKQCVSEGQGYGMIIVALMAGYDTAAKTTYDGLYNYYKAHPSNHSKNLMAWAQTKEFKDIDKTSATDGGMDIAYSLLLADKQWGSNGSINYLQQANAVIADIMKEEINHLTFSILLSDAVEFDSPDYFDMRSSDFMPSHFKAFKKSSKDINWDKVIDNNYKLFDALQKTNSPDAGLVPDFIVTINTEAKPAPSSYLESRYDGYYNYNACRVPWRVATDYLMNGDTRAKKFVEKINNWIRITTKDKPDNISAGYSLDGDDLKSRNFEAMSFIAPFAVAAMVDKKNQVWLNVLWKYINGFDIDQFDYYDNSIKMISLLLLSGNYWNPNS